ncbi:TPA: transcriptional regulator, partial [Pseudomonas aeruginosa]|nr:transcriptional regulator [Pseudomonas aeruginosa]
GEDYFFAPDESHVRLVERDSGQPVPRLQVRAGDGSPLAAEDTRVSRD